MNKYPSTSAPTSLAKASAHRSPILRASIASALALCAMTSVSAAESELVTLEEVLVTATRRAESVVDVPYNIQSISADTLSKTGAQDMADIARLVPGLNFTDGGARDGVTLVLRGLRTGFEGMGAQTTTTYVDDTQVDRPTAATPLDLRLVDIERIEVLRGPQGTLYGGGAIGGTIRYISKKPNLDAIEGRIGGSLSTTKEGGNNMDTEGMINVPLVDGKAAIRAAAGYYDNDGFLENLRVGKDNVNFDKTTAARVATYFAPSDSLSIEATYYFQRGKFGERDQVNESGGKYVSDYNTVASETTDAHLANLTINFDMGGATLTSSTSYFKEGTEGEQDVTRTVRDDVYASIYDSLGLPPEDLPEFTAFNAFDTSSETFTEELRLVSKSGGFVEWIAGAYWNERKLTDRFQEHVPIPFPGQSDFEDLLAGEYGLAAFPINDTREYYLDENNRFRQWAGFGEITFNLSKQWQVSVGGRYFDYESESTSYVIDQYGPDGRDEAGFARTVPFPEEFTYASANDDGQVFRFNTSYKLDKGLVYLTVAEGYRPGGFNQIPTYINATPEQRQFKPDSITSYEVGAKSSVFDNRLYVSSAVFYIDWQDIQTTVPIPGEGFFVQGNAGKASSRGVELELAYRDLFVRGLTVSGGYSYTDVHLEETVVSLGFKDDPAPLVSKNTASYVVDYAWQVGALDMGIDLAGSYTGETASAFGASIPDELGAPVDNPYYLEIDAYWLHSLSLRLEGEQWSSRLFVDNLLNEYAPLFRGYSEILFSPYATSEIVRGVNRPRTIGLGIDYRF